MISRRPKIFEEWDDELYKVVGSPYNTPRRSINKYNVCIMCREQVDIEQEFRGVIYNGTLNAIKG